VTVTADEVTVRKTAGGAAYKAGFNASADLNVGIGNLNGLDIAPMPVTGWMYVYVVSNGTDFQTQISTSGTGPSPAAGTAAGYAYWALVGAFYKSAGAAWRAATQVGQRVFYAGEQTTIALSSLVASTGGAAINLTTYLPPSANMALGNVGMVTVSSTSQGVSLALNSTGLGLQYFCGVGLAATTFGGAAAQWAYRVPVLGTAALFYKTATNSGNYRLSVTGYEY
jgi:hypothetical protein